MSEHQRDWSPVAVTPRASLPAPASCLVERPAVNPFVRAVLEVTCVWSLWKVAGCWNPVCLLLSGEGQALCIMALWVTLCNPGFSAVEQSRGQANVVLQVSGVT